MNCEDLVNITKQRDQYRSIVEFIVSGDCPDPDKPTDCLINGMHCANCLIKYAEAETEKINDEAT